MTEDVNLSDDELAALRAIGMNSSFNEMAKASAGGILDGLISRGLVTLDERQRPRLTEGGRKAAIIR